MLVAHGSRRTKPLERATKKSPDGPHCEPIARRLNNIQLCRVGLTGPDKGAHLAITPQVPLPALVRSAPPASAVFR